MSTLSTQEMSRMAVAGRSHLYICAVKSTRGKQELVLVNQQDIKFVNLFKRLFNYGVLAHTKFSLNDVTEYLSRFNWAAAKNAEVDTMENKAYRTACVLANRSLLQNFSCKTNSNRQFSENSDAIPLWEKVCEKRTIMDGEFDAQHEIFWNPEMRVIHLEKQLQTKVANVTTNQIFASNTPVVRNLLPNLKTA